MSPTSSASLTSANTIQQIKNTIRTAQALAVNNKEPLSMEHIKRVLDVSNAFDRDLKGGPGFEDAMRGYF
jgi:hypothetical protein